MDEDPFPKLLRLPHRWLHCLWCTVRFNGSLRVGAHDDHGDLISCANVATGFSQRSSRRVYGMLAPLCRDRSPFRSRHSTDGNDRGVHWVAPFIVGRVEFREYTNRLRHNDPTTETLLTPQRAIGSRQPGIPRHASRVGEYVWSPNIVGQCDIGRDALRDNDTAAEPVIGDRTMGVCANSSRRAKTCRSTPPRI